MVYGLIAQLTSWRNDVPNDTRALKQQEEDAKEPDNRSLLVGRLPLRFDASVARDGRVRLAHLRQVSALGRPHRRGPEPEDNASRYERVELWVELGSNVDRVAEHGKHHRVLDGQVVYEERGQEHAGQDEAGVQRGEGYGAEAVDRVDGALEAGHALERGEEGQEAEADDDHVLHDPPGLSRPIVHRVLGSLEVFLFHWIHDFNSGSCYPRKKTNAFFFTFIN